MPNNTDESNKCRLHRFEKNHYFYGKLMTVRDFETEQSYFDEKNHLINKLLHGSGLVCGFEDLQIEDKGDKITIDFIDGGMALDCCGREIVVPANTLGKPIVDSDGNSVPDLTANPYLYLKYKPCYDGYVAAASNPSSCEERCCPGRIVEDFEVVASNIEPQSKNLICRAELQGESEGTIEVDEWLEKLEIDHISCPQCEENEEYKVFLGKVEAVNGGFAVNREDTEKYRIFFTQKELYQLIKCHILDFKNPHGVTAEQIGALVSVDGVSNPGGDVDLVPDNAISITPDDASNRITIGENRSTNKDNPHEVNAVQVEALVSINGIRNPGGNINLKQGANITITPDPASHTINIASTGGADPGNNVRSVSTSINPGRSNKYSREDHVHDLEEGVVDFVNLSETLQNQLNLLFMYLRERALKCTVSNLKAVAKPLDIDIALEISESARNAVDKRIYEEEGKFISFMDGLLKIMRRFADKIQGRVPKDIFDIFVRLLGELNAAIESGDALRVAILQDEICFYISEMEIRG